jgi:hypothetical protein
MFFKRYIVFGLMIAALQVCLAGISFSQESDEEEEEAIVLLPPDFVSPEYKFGIALPEGYMAFDFEDESAWLCEIVGEIEQPTGRITSEPLPSGVTDVSGFWQAMKDRDELMERNITYEKVSSISGTPAIQARVEQIDSGEYILSIFWVFIHDGHGFTLAAYLPAGGSDAVAAKDLALQLSQQFRWMTDEEIAAHNENPPEADLGGGTEF